MAADRNSSNADEDVNDDETATGTWRKTRPGPKKFEVTIKSRTWKKIKPCSQCRLSPVTKALD